MRKLIRTIAAIPIVGPLARQTARCLGIRKRQRFPGSADYWENRYKVGGTSGKGSYDLLARFKAEVLNKFVAEHHIHKVIEFGSGDGNQLLLASYPSYTGYDVSPTAIARCRDMFREDNSKEFKILSEYQGERADLSMSLDVIYHLVEDPVFVSYMERLFDSADRFVVIYSSNVDSGVVDGAPHVRHRCFDDWIKRNRPKWRLLQHIPNQFPLDSKTGEGSFADFYFYQLDHASVS